MQGDVRRMAGDVRVAGRVGVPLRLTARLHAVEEVTNVEGRRIAADFFDRSSGQQLRRTQDELAAVAGFHETRLPFKADWARAERNPSFFTEDQLDTILVTGHQL